MKIPQHTYLKLQKQAAESVMTFEDYLSDMDYAYNPATEKYDIPAVEWDGIYGKHWQKFESEEARTAYLNERESRLNKLIIEETKRLTNNWYAQQQAKQAAKPTLGNLCPEVFAKLSSFGL